MQAGNRADGQADAPETPRREVIAVETAGLVTSVGGFVVTATQYFVPSNVNYSAGLSMGFIGMITGAAVWYRSRQQRLRRERSEDRHEG